MGRTPTILLASELGAALGHVSVLGRLARELAPAHIHAAVPDPEVARPWFPRDVTFHVAPRAPARTGTRLHRSFSDLLEDNGWSGLDTLGALVEAWRGILDACAPEVVVADSAPTLALASRGRGLPLIGTGTPFLAAPHRDPWPGLRVWNPQPDAPLRARERRLVQRANAVRDPGSAPLGAMRDLYDRVQWVLQGPSALDPWLEWRRPEDRHAGPLPVLHGGTPMAFPPGEGPRIFAYLKPSFPAFEVVLRALAAKGRVLAYVPGVVSEAPGVQVVPHPVHLERLVGSTDLLVTHSVLGTGSAFLGRGVPCLFLPQHLEQLAIGRCAAALPGVVTVPQPAVARGFREALARSLDRRAAEGAARAAGRIGKDGMPVLVSAVRAAVPG